MTFLSGRQIFFNSRGALELPTFPRGREKSVFFYNFMLFLLNVMIFFQKNKRRNHSNCPYISKSNRNKHLI